MAVTIKEISKKTGLSIPTVGNVLGKSGARYSEETRRKVLEAAAELGYKPNASARAMRRGRFGCAALVLSRSRQNIQSNIPPGLLDGLDDQLSIHDMHLTVCRLTDEELSREEFFLPKVLRESMADGMIVNYTHAIPQPMLDLIHAHHAPAVFLNAKLKSDCVYPDDYAGAYNATKKFIEFGHRRIAYFHLRSPGIFNEPFEKARANFHYSEADRERGYADAMKEAGLKTEYWPGDKFVADELQYDACRQFLDRKDRPTAILLYTDRDVSLLMAAAAELKLQTPKDLSMMVFYPIPYWCAGHFVTNVAVPASEVGKRAVEMLIQKLAKPTEARPAEAVPYGVNEESLHTTLSRL